LWWFTGATAAKNNCNRMVAWLATAATTTEAWLFVRLADKPWQKVLLADL